jgi:RNA polymerase sigma-70 factor (ECF subfamily)
MDESSWLIERFEADRPRLRAVAYRMLGSLSEAEDAVQEAWLRLARSDAAAVENLSGWLTTVVARVCLDVLRARTARREESITAVSDEPRAERGAGADPEGEALLADSVGAALLVVLDTLAPAERLAFVLHDLFAMPFEDIAPIVGRSPEAARQLASRARRRVRGSPLASDADKRRQRAVVEAFVRAARDGDLDGLLAVLDPDAVVRIDAAARIDAPRGEVGQPREVRGAATWAPQLLALARGAVSVQLAEIDGSFGLIVAPSGLPKRAVLFTITSDRVTRVEVVADPARLRAMEVVVP